MGHAAAGHMLGRGEGKGKEDGLTLIPPAVFMCGSWPWFKASLLALMPVLVGSPVTQETHLGSQEVVLPLWPPILPPKLPKGNRLGCSDPLAYLSSKWVKAQSSARPLLWLQDKSVAFVCCSDN